MTTRTSTRFPDRRAAGVALAERVRAAGLADPVVLALPRGGVPVGFEVARALRAPLDVLVVRKLGVPFQPELAMGAIGEGDVRVLDPTIVRLAQVTPEEITATETRERAELERRVARYRHRRPMTGLEGRTAVVVDDGVATGSTARAALLVARELGARRVVLAVPVASPEAVHDLAAVADDIIAVLTPSPMMAVGAWYEQFAQTTDDEVEALLHGAHEWSDDPVSDCDDPLDADERDVEIRSGALTLPGRLTVPKGARGLVLFAHGSGSSRHSPRNRFVAEQLEGRGLATLLFDLLSTEEAVDRGNVFDIELLAVRLLLATHWARGEPQCRDLPIGFFGASTGAAAALWAAAEDPSVAAVVSRGGRPDLAAERLDAVRAPTLLIVGSLDRTVLHLNELAAARLRCPAEIAIVPGASHLFEEPGTLGRAATLAGEWFARHLSRRPDSVDAPA